MDNILTEQQLKKKIKNLKRDKLRLKKYFKEKINELEFKISNLEEKNKELEWEDSFDKINYN